MHHVHFLGTTGSGKTPTGLIPLLEQLMLPADSSLIVVDLKGDSLELLASMDATNTRIEERTKQRLPLRIFSIENGIRTFGFNPFLTKGWLQLSFLERTDIIANSLGLNYGLSYAREFFTSCNSAPILAGNISNPDAMSFRQPLVDVERNLRSKNPRGLMPEMKRSSTHAWYTLSRMAVIDAINVTGPRIEAPDVIDHRINLGDFFTTPQMAYFKLPSTTGASTSPAIARLVANYLLTAGKRAKRTQKVYLVIEEFQRMASESMDQLFQMARSLDIGIILANQNMSDLETANKGLASSIEANCHWRQWFSIGNLVELEAVTKLFGTREETEYSTTYSDKGSSTTARAEDVPRANISDLQTISDNPNLSILHITGPHTIHVSKSA